MNIKKDHGKFIHTDKGWLKVEKPNIIAYGKVIKPDNTLYDVVDTYCSVKEYQEITGQI